MCYEKLSSAKLAYFCSDCFRQPLLTVRKLPEKWSKLFALTVPTVSMPDDANLPHLSVVGDNYTVLVSGKQTEGRYCLIDMLVLDGSGPPPHRHSFEEMFTLLEGELEFTFRGEMMTVSQGATVNIPANAPHQFRNASGKTVHMLCTCTPAGQEEFFAQVGDRVAGRNSPPPKLSPEEQAERGKRAAELAPKYRTEML